MHPVWLVALVAAILAPMAVRGLAWWVNERRERRTEVLLRSLGAPSADEKVKPRS
jgi:hypothetical protein